MVKVVVGFIIIVLFLVGVNVSVKNIYRQRCMSRVRIGGIIHLQTQLTVVICGYCRFHLRCCYGTPGIPAHWYFRLLRWSTI